jgi:hypothetical protein
LAVWRFGGLAVRFVVPEFTVNHATFYPKMLAVWLIGTFFLVLSSTKPVLSKNLHQCSADEAKIDGSFSCIDGCDENHNANDVGAGSYCLNYLPSNGQCYMKPYYRDDVLTCNGKFGLDDAPRWLVSIGGSNNYFMLKQMLDMMLELPFDAEFSPQESYNSTGKL